MSDSLPEYSKEGLMAIIDIMPVAVAVVDENVIIALVNPAIQRFTNKSKEELIGQLGGEALGCASPGRNPEECHFGENCVKCKFRAAVKETVGLGVPRKLVETSMAFKDGEERILRFSTLPLKLSGKRYALLTIEDLTDAWSFKEQIIEKEKLAAVLETTGGICHELSQPLQVIMGYSQIMMERTDLDPEITKAIEAIDHELTRLAKLTHKLTRITRYETKPYLQSKIIDIHKSSLGKP